MMSEEKLSSWKEIAAYLKRDERTVRRWEQKSGLPVHRVEKGGSVYAYPQEIDSWLSSQRPDQFREQQSRELTGNTEQAMAASSEEEAAFTTITPDARLLTPLRDEESARNSASGRKYLLVTSVLILVAVTTAFLYASKTHLFSTQQVKAAGATRPGAGFFDGPIPEETATQLKKVVKDSQIWEALTLYAAPWTCDAHDLERYWEPSSKAFVDVAESASRLNERGWHYGFGARLLDFEYRYVRLSHDGLSAEVGTREHWWLPVYSRDDEPISSRNPDQGPYEIDYLLTKIGDQWYVKSDNTPYSQWKPREITCKNWPQ